MGFKPMTPECKSGMIVIFTNGPLKNISFVLTTSLDFTDGLFPITCYECTIEQGPLQRTLIHLYLFSW